MGCMAFRSQYYQLRHLKKRLNWGDPGSFNSPLSCRAISETLKTNDKIRKLTNDIFENWWIAYSYRMLHMTEMASPDITFVWKM